MIVSFQIHFVHCPNASGPVCLHNGHLMCRCRQIYAPTSYKTVSEEHSVLKKKKRLFDPSIDSSTWTHLGCHHIAHCGRVIDECIETGWCSGASVRDLSIWEAGRAESLHSPGHRGVKWISWRGKTWLKISALSTEHQDIIDLYQHCVLFVHKFYGPFGSLPLCVCVRIYEFSNGA